MEREQLQEKVGVPLEFGPGWDNLLISFLSRLEAMQKEWLWFKAPEDSTCGQPAPGKLFEFIFLQTKEKYGELRIYYQIASVEQDWEIFDKEEYEKKIYSIQERVEGMVDLLEELSGHICENCGAKGEIQERYGWFRCSCKNCFGFEQALNDLKK